MLLQQLTQFYNKFLMTAANDVQFAMRTAQRCNDMCGDYMNGDFSEPAKVPQHFKRHLCHFESLYCACCAKLIKTRTRLQTYLITGKAPCDGILLSDQKQDRFGMS